MPRKRKLHACHACGAKQLNDGSRFCGTECERQHAEDHSGIRTRLQAEGFTRNGTTPNMWSKDGVSVTEEECYAHGIDKILTRHQSVVLNPAVPVTRKRNR